MSAADEPPATMTQVAKRAEVSLKTVSRVLNKEPFVTEGLRQKVLQAASDLNYRFNHAARSLRSTVNRQIVLAVDHADRSSYLESIHLGAFKACQSHGMTLYLDTWLDGVASCVATVDRQQPVGVILVPPLCDDRAVLDALAQRGIACARIAPSLADPNTYAVAMDDVAAARELTDHLIALGHRRIGFIAGRPGHGASDDRLRGYDLALADAGLPRDPALIRPGDFLYATSLDSAEALLDRPDRPSAIVASNDEMAAAVLTVAYRHGLKVPDDLSVVGFDDIPMAAVVTPNLTTIRQPIEEMAADAVRLLVDHLSAFDMAATDSLLDYRLIVRASTAPPPLGG